MRGIFNFLKVELKLLLKDKSFYIWGIIFPIFFIFIFSNMGSNSSGKEIRQKICIKENIKNDEFIKAIVKYLEDEKLEIVFQDKIKDKKCYLLVFPDDFSNKIKNKIKTEIVIVSNIRDKAKFYQVKISVYRAIYRWLIDKEFNIKKIKDIVGVNVLWAGKSSSIPGGVEHQLPATILVFLLFNLFIFGGTQLLNLREKKLLERFSITPLGKFGVWAGFFLLNLLVAFILINLITFSSIALFKANFGLKKFLNLYVVLFSYSIFVSSVGILIGSFFKKREAVIGVSVLVANLLAALGGCWWPIEIVPDFMKKIAAFLPTGWAMRASDIIMFYGLPFPEVLNYIIYLLLGSLVSSFFSIKYFKIEKF